MKKILHISKYYYPDIGGIEQTARDCVNALQKKEYMQKVICFNHIRGNKVDEIDGVEIIRCDCQCKISAQSLSLYFGKMLKKTIREFEPDCIIIHYPNPFAAHYLLKYIPANTKLVIYWHSDIIKQKILGKFFHKQNRRLVQRADRILTTSPNYIRGSRYLKDVSEKCRVVPSCINEKRLEVTPEEQNKARQIREKNKGKIICFSLGRHVEYKGFSYLIDAAKYLEGKCEFYLSGDGPLTEELRSKAADSSNFHFLGVTSDSDLKANLLAADIFCFPSITKNEAFGLALAEGMYFGKPCVTFTIEGSGVNYVSLDGVTGIDVPNRDVKEYADAIMKLANDNKLRETYGKAARQRVLENFLYFNYAENIKSVINDLLR